MIDNRIHGILVDPLLCKYFVQIVVTICRFLIQRKIKFNITKVMKVIIDGLCFLWI